MKFIDKFILKFMWKGTGCRIAKVNKNKIEGIILIQKPLKSYNSKWNKHTGSMTSTDNPETESHIHAQLIFFQSYKAI